jgi:hypothetical protein
MLPESESRALPVDTETDPLAPERDSPVVIIAFPVDRVASLVAKETDPLERLALGPLSIVTEPPTPSVECPPFREMEPPVV